MRNRQLTEAKLKSSR